MPRKCQPFTRRGGKVLVDQWEIYADSTSTYKTLALELPELEGLLPHSEAMWVEALLTDCSTDEIDWTIDARVGFDRNNEGSAVSFFSADQSTIGSVKVDSSLASSNYRRHCRLILKWRLHTAIASPKNGKLSAVLYVKTLGQ